MKKKPVRRHYTYSDFHIPISKTEVRVPGFHLFWVRQQLLGCIPAAVEVKTSIRDLLLPGELLFPAPTNNHSCSLISTSHFGLMGTFLFMQISLVIGRQRDLVHTALTPNLTSPELLTLVTLPLVTQQSFITRITSVFNLFDIIFTVLLAFNQELALSYEQQGPSQVKLSLKNGHFYTSLWCPNHSSSLLPRIPVSNYMLLCLLQS